VGRPGIDSIIIHVILNPPGRGLNDTCATHETKNPAQELRSSLLQSVYHGCVFIDTRDNEDNPFQESR